MVTHEVLTSSKMSEISRHFERLVTLVLIVLFTWRVALSGKALLDKKIASTVSKQYSKWRLFPSFSICFVLKSADEKISYWQRAPEILENVEDNLQRILDDVVVDFQHSNQTESG